MNDDDIVVAHPPWRRTTSVLGVLAVGFAASSVMMASGWHGVLPRGQGAAAMWVAGVGIGGAALMAWTARRDLPFVHHVADEPAERSRQMLWLFQIPATLLAMAIAYGRGGRGPDHPQPDAGLLIASVLPAVTMMIGIVRAFRELRRLAPVQHAPQLPVPPPPHTWGVIEGIVSGPVVATATSTCRVHSRRSGKNGWIWETVAITITAASEFRVDVGDWQARVQTRRMIWAARPSWQPRDGEGAIRAVGAIRPGDRVRVLVRTGGDGDTNLRAEESESLYVVVGTWAALRRYAFGPPFVIAAYVALVVVSALL